MAPGPAHRPRGGRCRPAPGQPWARRWGGRYPPASRVGREVAAELLRRGRGTGRCPGRGGRSGRGAVTGSAGLLPLSRGEQVRAPSVGRGERGHGVALRGAASGSPLPAGPLGAPPASWPPAGVLPRPVSPSGDRGGQRREAAAPPGRLGAGGAAGTGVAWRMQPGLWARQRSCSRSSPRSRGSQRGVRQPPARCSRCARVPSWEI